MCSQTFRGKGLANGCSVRQVGVCSELGAGLARSQDGTHDAMGPSASGARLRGYVSFVRAVKIRGGAGGRGGRGYYCATGWESGWGVHDITLTRAAARAFGWMKRRRYGFARVSAGGVFDVLRCSLYSGIRCTEGVSG